MPINKNQWKRLRTLLGMLRKGNAVNFENYELHMLFEDKKFKTSPRTFARDIAALRSLGADIKYRQRTKSFELKNRDWSFEGPAEIDSVKTLLLSECVAKGFLPPLIRKELRETVDSIFMSYGTDVPNETRLADFQVFTPEFSPQIDSEIFRQAYQAWENSSYLKISYCSIKGHDSEKLIPPGCLPGITAAGM